MQIDYNYLFTYLGLSLDIFVLKSSLILGFFLCVKGSPKAQFQRLKINLLRVKVKCEFEKPHFFN